MTSTAHGTMSCKVCGSSHTVRVGRINGVQRWECRDCGRRFMDSDTRFGMKTPAFQVTMAIQMYYQGMSLNTIRRYLHHRYNNYPSDSTIYNWVEKYTDIAISKYQNYRPDVGTTWLMHEITLNFNSQPLWILDILDTDTFFLLATQIYLNRNTDDAGLVMGQAVRKAGKSPKVVMTDKLTTSLTEMGLAFSGDILYLDPGMFFVDDKIADEFVRFQDALKLRTDHMSNLKSIDKVQKFNEGWLVYYNYFRPLKSFAGKTPAEVAKTRYPPWGLS